MIADGEPGLETVEVPVGGEARRREAQLVGRGQVLSVDAGRTARL